MAEIKSDIPWDTYEKYAQIYLDRDIFKGTPMTGKMLRDAAETTYKRTGKYVPLDLALSQGQMESKMGLLSRNASTNPFNVGEYDEGTKIRFPDTQTGINAYYDLMARRYLAKQNYQGLLTNFVNDEGNRYASNPNYEKMIGRQINYIRQYVDNKTGARRK
jgi:hypothetical protein